MSPCILGGVSEWIYLIHPPRDNFAATMTAEEQAVWAEHFVRLKQLIEDGTLILAGPTLGTANTGIAIFEAPDEETARQIMEALSAPPARLALFSLDVTIVVVARRAVRLAGPRRGRDWARPRHRAGLHRIHRGFCTTYDSSVLVGQAAAGPGRKLVAAVALWVPVRERIASSTASVA